ncbi:glycerol-3-phosphate dehydrogenase [Legionella oakridgensis]|nr:glycerol-3-phosphate dehydrogenase [Legionella oakridgensis]ETO93015.1 homodimeric glycerol 3-phosphate dehydrogenase [Legionella oakridgensis RV-2-2007]KTD43422.1 glycerol-3-phosphate dehydrogenase [Legionella oakridgensis]STY20413.1 glycerol-3-phosphate dehydrogenase [Legionella longbeachae]
MTQVYDVAIIGGGINGCGCAADAALRGLSVLLCEQDDLGSQTSSSSTKLIHGGLRYLEYYDFAMVKKALDERQILLQQAPHLIHPILFVLPHKKNRRPVWMLRTGLYLYDHLSRKNKLPKTKFIRRAYESSYFQPLKKDVQKGFLFYDCATDDARLVLINALQAKYHGATILTRTTLIKAEVNHHVWQLTLQPVLGDAIHIQAKSVINAAGPWVKPVSNLLNRPLKYKMSLVKGSHIVVPKLYEGKQAYVLQHEDNRIVFVIPYHHLTMIGTTDRIFTGDPKNVHIEPDEINYLLDLVNHYFLKKLTTEDIIHSWSGVRPLLADERKAPKALSRDYAYDYTSAPAPVVTIYGGKLTTYRQLSLHVINQLQNIFPDLPPSNSATIPLPGATLAEMNFTEYKKFAEKKYHWLDKNILDRYLSTYGTRVEQFLQGCKTQDDLGMHFGETLYQAEVNYLLQEEWARTVDDILWRRTKLGLKLNTAAQNKLQHYLSQQHHPSHKSALQPSLENNN